MKETDYPSLYQTADKSAAEVQKNFFMLLAIYFIFLILAATLSTINAPDAIFAGTQTVLLLATLGIVIYLANRQPQRIWYGARALAESAKTITWRYMMRAEPFDADDRKAKQLFILSLRKIFDANKYASAQSAEIVGLDQVTDQMMLYRNQTLDERIALYKQYRVEEQQSWYVKKAAFNKRLSKRWFTGLIIINSIAIILSIGRIIWPNTTFWPTDVFVVIAGAAMTWIQVHRYQELAASYALTAHEIGLLKAEIPDDKEEVSFSIFVSDAESAFSREHTQWQARRDGEHTP